MQNNHFVAVAGAGLLGALVGGSVVAFMAPWLPSSRDAQQFSPPQGPKDSRGVVRSLEPIQALPGTQGGPAVKPPRLRAPVADDDLGGARAATPKSE